jgi:alpha-galactosidase
MFCCFNWTDTAVTLTKRLYRAVRVTDFWTGEPLGRMDNRLTLEDMPPHSARLLEAVDA